MGKVRQNIDLKLLLFWNSAGLVFVTHRARTRKKGNRDITCRSVSEWQNCDVESAEPLTDYIHSLGDTLAGGSLSMLVRGFFTSSVSGLNSLNIDIQRRSLQL